VDISMQDYNETTPIHWAVRYQMIDMIKALKEADVNVSSVIYWPA